MKRPLLRSAHDVRLVDAPIVAQSERGLRRARRRGAAPEAS